MHTLGKELMPRRMSSKQALTAYYLCVERDGEKCISCGWTYEDPFTKIQLEHPLRGRAAMGLELDHKDGNPWHNPVDGSNWQILCKVCNRLKQNGGIDDMCVSVDEGQKKRAAEVGSEGERRGSEDVATGRESRARAVREAKEGERGPVDVNSICQPIFEAYVYRWVWDEEKVDYQQIVDNGAREAHCSQESCKRYLAQMASDGPNPGPLLIVKGLHGKKVVVMRPKE